VQKILGNPILIIFSGLIVVAAWWSLRGTRQRILISSQRLDQINQEVTELESQLESLKKDLTLAQNPLSKEIIIRNELLMKKSGEIVVQLPSLEENQDKTKLEENQTATPWQEWQQILF
jgi:cell division protein FtsB